jgi:dihydroneopterin aldolase
VTVHKPDAPIKATFADVQLTITRRREAAGVGDRTGKAEGPA